ncbi:MAG: hypothetical protein ACREDR_43735, partial [Blastocatellia bacterium]
MVDPPWLVCGRYFATESVAVALDLIQPIFHNPPIVMRLPWVLPGVGPTELAVVHRRTTGSRHYGSFRTT